MTLEPSTERAPDLGPLPRRAGRVRSAGRRKASVRIGVALASVVALILVFGPLVAPYSPYDIVGGPFDAPSSAHPFGTDNTGRDVLSRVLAGGVPLVPLAFVATVAALLIGGFVGMVAGATRGPVSGAIMRVIDVLLAFPAFLLLLLIAGALGPGRGVAVAGAAIGQLPQIARVCYSATLEVSVMSFVEAAEARGESRVGIIWRDVVPNVRGTLIAIGAPAFVVSVLLVAGLNFLGLGAAPPAPDWGSMISENRMGLEVAPLSVIAPAFMIVLLSVAPALIADGLDDSYRFGRR